MTAIPVLTPSINGAVHAPTTASAGPDTIAPGGRPVILYMNNGGAGASTLAIVIPGLTKYGLAQPDINPSTAITAGAHGTFLLPPDIADPVTNLISITASASASVTFFAVSA